MHRARFIWCSPSTEGVAEVPHTAVKPAGTMLDHAHLVRWTGPKQPRAFEPEHPSAMWAFQGECGRKGVRSGAGSWTPSYAGGRFLTFTTAFWHPADRGNRDDQELMARFKADGRRFPLAHYAAGNMLQMPDGNLRPLTAVERERLGPP